MTEEIREIGDREIEREERESIESREYRHRHIDIDIEKRKRKGRERRFYVPSKFENTFDMLQTILKREHSNFSQWVRDQTESYVRLHEPGNPQQRLDTILKIGKAYHAPGKICEVRDCCRDVTMILLWHDFKTKENREVGMCRKHGLMYSREFPDIWKVLK